jgi:ubiquinone/menaquinone biosynthesis C-methylase UbiE
MDVEKLDYSDGYFDSVVDTFSLCVFPRPDRALREMARVVRPGTGRVLLLENSRSSNALLGAYQDLTASFIADNGGKGCRWNQDVIALVKEAGLEILEAKPISGGLFVLIEARCAPAGS